MLRGPVEIAAYGFVALVAVPCVLYLLVRLFRCVRHSALWHQCRAVILALLAAATIATIKAQKRTGTTGVPPVAGGTTGTTGVSPVANPITNTLHISAIAVFTNGMVTLTAAWPENFLTADQTLDVLGKENLHNETWMWLTNGIVTVGATNISWTLENQSPSNYFYKVVLRDSLTDMDDPDYDGIPNVYELHHDTNPWVPDSILVPKLTVGTNDFYASISAALAASTPYSVIEIAPGEYELSSPVVVPSHPIMVTAAKPYTVIRSTSNLGVFEVNAGQTEETLFRNLYLWLGATSGFQVGFWCGGNLPWDGVPASATFDNVYVRMPNPNVQYRGWIVYRRCAEPVMIRNCTVNAAGATWAIGIDAYGSPPLVIDSCSFLNFPFDGALGCGCGVFLRTSGSSDAGSNVVISRTLFDESFTNAWPFARFDSTNSYFVTVSNCLVPCDLPPAYLPDVSSNITVTNAMLTWFGIPTDESPSAALGIGPLFPIPNNPLTDMDNDGLSDYEEVYVRGTDPYLFDSDNDGVDDGTEVFSDGTDPMNAHSFKQELAVVVTNTASTTYAVYTAWGYSSMNWETNGLVAFPQGHGTNLYTNASSQGATHIKAFCDLNENGEYDGAYDILLVHAIPYGDTARFNFTFGDIDGDGLSDAEERQYGTDPYLIDSDNDGVDDATEISDGTDPMNLHSFTQRVFVTVTNTASTTYAVYTAWGHSPTNWEANGLVAFPQGHGTNLYINVSSQGATHVKAFCDLNGNGEYDANADILLMCQIHTGSTAQVNFAFGDVDGDGVTDMQEREEQTDPYDARNFRLVATVVFTDTDKVEMVTNLVAFSKMTGVWSNACRVASFTNGLYTLGIDTNLIEGTLHVMCLRDFDGDCEYSSVHDVLYEKTLVWSDNRKTVVYSLGDLDHDSLPDSKEMTEGTDPLNRADYCFAFSVTYTDIFSTTNQLTTEVFFGTNRIEGPITMTGRTWHCETWHLVSSNSEIVTVYFWDDANFNGVRDESETAVTNRFPITGHEMFLTNRLVYGAFDTDNDEMLDSWELIHGLSPTNVADAVLDADRDGFVNLHEFWAGTDPNDPLDDGYGTALYAITHGIDDRIAISSLAAIAKSNYLNYSRFQLPEILSVNPDSWASGIDFSCTSIWNDSLNYQYGDPATLLSPQHVLLAKHACSPIGRNYTFQDINGSRCVRTLVATRGIDRTDITIGLLDSELPSTFSPVKLLPVGYERYLGSGTFLPVLHMDQERKSLVQELPKMPSFSRRYYEIFCNRGHTPRRLDFYEGLVGGDSGNPCFLLLGNERVLLYAVQGHQPGNYYASVGYHTMLFSSEIQEAMNVLSSARGCPLFVLQSVDLSSYDLLEN